MEELISLVTDNPGTPEFVELAEKMFSTDSIADALLTLQRGLSVDPSNGRARLLLAKYYFEAECYPFAAREVLDLAKRFPESSALKSLNQKLNPLHGSIADDSDEDLEETIAEADFEFDILDELEDE